MRAVLTLAIANVVLWGAFVATFPGTHFAWPGSYKFWWFDDAPLAVFVISVVAAALMTFSPFRKLGILKGGSIMMLSVTLLAIIPYAACSGGGV